MPHPRARPAPAVAVAASRGRRPGVSGTRDAIVLAARRQFATSGYDRTSMRAVAAEARVDPSLVVHYFGSKAGLFAEAVELPFDPATALPHLLAFGVEGLGERLARLAVDVLESEHGRARMVALVRAATSEPAAAQVIRDLITTQLLTPIAESLGTDHADLRGALIASQLVGLTMARCIVLVEPLASATPDQVVRAIGPNLQRYLSDPLIGADPTRSEETL